MTRHPYGPDELDRHDPDLDRIAQELEAFASGEDQPMPSGLVSRIQAAVDAEPEPARGWWAGLLAGMEGWQRAGRLVAAAAVVAVAVVGALALAQLVDVVRPDVGTSPEPSPLLSPAESASPVPSPTLAPTPSPTSSPTSSRTPSPTTAPATPVPTASDDDETPEPSETPEPDETPEPSDSDNSGPGGGGGDDDGG